jgi:hypothetical protein
MLEESQCVVAANWGPRSTKPQPLRVSIPAVDGRDSLRLVRRAYGCSPSRLTSI